MEPEISLDYAIEKILLDVKDMLQTERDTAGGKLADVKDIILGDKVEVAPDVPYLQIYGGNLVVTGADAISETWDMEVFVVAVADGVDASETYLNSVKLVAKARSALRKGRRLKSREFVDNVGGGWVATSGEWNQKMDLSASTILTKVQFRTVEL